MQTLVAVAEDKLGGPGLTELGRIQMGPCSIPFAIAELDEPEFDVEADENRDKVLLAVRALSCNFRDKALLVENFLKMEERGGVFIPFGSEFCADVLQVGADVTGLTRGDRVMGNGAYPNSGVEGIKPGVSTNFASLGYLRLPSIKVIRVPNEMSDTDAAAFSLGAQTAAGMIRRSGIRNTGGRPIIFSSRSATSLFVTQQLLYYGFKPICVSGSEWTQEERDRLVPATVLHSTTDAMSPKISACTYTHAFDPFFDINFATAVWALAFEGTYVTCGFRDQHPLLSEGTPQTAEPIVRGGLSLAIPNP